MAHFPDLINYRWACTRWKFKQQNPWTWILGPLCMWTQCERNLQHERGLIANTANENQWHMTYSYSTQFPANYFSFPTKNYITYRHSNHFQFHSIWPCGNKQVSPWPNEDPFVVLQTSRRMYIFKEHSEHSCKLKGKQLPASSKQNIEAPPPQQYIHTIMGHLLHCCTLYLSTTQGH